MEKNKFENMKKYRLDIIVIAVILVISILTLLIVTMTKKEGSVAVVENNVVRVAEYSLYLNCEYSLNGGTNVLVIENGEAYLNYSN